MDHSIMIMTATSIEASSGFWTNQNIDTMGSVCHCVVVIICYTITVLWQLKCCVSRSLTYDINHLATKGHRQIASYRMSIDDHRVG